MKEIYESAIADMTRLLEETVDNYSKALEDSTMEPLFCVSNKQFTLMRAVEYFSNYQVRNGCRQICIDICKEMNMNVKKMYDSVDFVIEMESEKIGFLLSFTSNDMPNVSDELMSNIEKLKVIVLQDSIDGQPHFFKTNKPEYRNYKYKEQIEQITMKQFFEMLGRNDYEDFKECIGRYNYDAEQKLGITVSAIPTKKVIEKHKSRIREALLSYFYEEELLAIFNEKEIKDMKNWFEKNHEVLISNADFSRSFISSEWYYDLRVKTDEEIEQTAIVAGYLKSLEQLLCSILLILSEDENNKFMFFTNQEGKKKTGEEKLPLNYANKKLVLTMAKHLLKSIKGNKKVVLRKTKMTDRVIEYLEQYVEETRNAYMHKDNLYKWSDIQIIRIKTYAVYFMVLGTFLIDVKKLSQINY
ncbi:MAG: hypothetical protein E7285_07485 [Lachnospiraceae bacterium]|nr:hypothetical protein [Lachnospiraceae bacterium]